MTKIMDNAFETVGLYSMVICPFAQRTRIHLQLKNIPFELVNLDICKPRPDWFLSMNPSGQVPVLAVDTEVTCDSSLISEYIEERFSHPLPFGSSPVQRYKLRELIKYTDTKFIPALYILMASQTEEERAIRMEAALETWRWLNSFLEECNYEGGFLGTSFGLGEISIAPFFLRYEVISYYHDFELPTGADYAYVQQWRSEILKAPVVRQTAETTNDLIKMYEDYTVGYFNGAIPPGKEVSSSDLSIPLNNRPMPLKAAYLRHTEQIR
ncbi:MAG: glutathione S-transferase family protein [Parvibaculaceae bacterium]|nr:glutathione S-transferase family protein [Parvibaculaceae bacterium]